MAIENLSLELEFEAEVPPIGTALVSKDSEPRG